MVVNSLELGQYKSLGIDTSQLEISEEIVLDQIKEKVHFRAVELGLRDDDSDSFLIVDDTAAAGLGIEGIDDLKSLKDYIRKQLLQEAIINKVMKEVLDGVVISYNDKAVDEELQIMMNELEKQATEEGFTLEFYCDYHDIKNIEELKTLCRDEIYTSYLEIASIEAIADKEKIMISEEKFSEALEIYENKNGNKPEDEHAFSTSLLVQETVNWLVNNNIAL